jgi:hypothetical protein
MFHGEFPDERVRGTHIDAGRVSVTEKQLNPRILRHFPYFQGLLRSDTSDSSGGRISTVLAPVDLNLLENNCRLADRNVSPQVNLVRRTSY